MRSRLVLPALLAAALTPPVAVTAPASAADAPYGEMVVTFLDVGQADSAYYVGPCGEAALVDAGDGSLDAVTSLMDAVAGHELKFATASHYDADHIGDFADIGAYLGGTVEAVYDRGGGADAKDTLAYAEYYDWAESTGGHQTVDIGDVFSLCEGAEEVTFTVVSAGTDGTAAAGKPVTEENDRGLCLHVEFGDLDIATCGDINGTDDGSRADVETAVAPSFGEVEVARLNHHGSAYSSNQTYIDTLAAEIAVLSVGANGYGHPDEDVVARWTEQSALFATGAGAGNIADGDLQVYSDGDTFVEIVAESGYGAEFVLDERPGSGSPLEPDPGTEPEPQPEPEAAPASGPRALDDSCPPGQIAHSGFADVPAGSTHAAAVDCVVHWQVTNGRSAGSYDPLTPVTRAQMASFIARLLDRASAYLPDSAGYDYFHDDNGSTHERNINRLAAAGVVGGKSSFAYDPTGYVTRAQMAAFLTRAYDYRATQHGVGALYATGDFFADDDASPLQEAINKAATAGFTGGYDDGTYRPGGQVRRDQMASFLARVLDLAVEEGMTSVPSAPAPPPATEPAPEPEPDPPANPGDSRNCGDFRTWREAQDWFETYYPYYGDVARLDGNNDKVACESLAGAP